MHLPSSAELLARRTVLVEGPITERSATDCIAQLLFLSHGEPSAPISLELNSPGGNVTASLAIISTMDSLQCRVCTFSRQLVGGTAIAIAAHGAHGFRNASASATFAFVQTYGEPGRGYVEAEISQFDQVLAELLSEDAGRHEQEVFALLRTERVLTASEALAFGVIDLLSDSLVTPKPKSGEGWLTRIKRIFWS